MEKREQKEGSLTEDYKDDGGRPIHCVHFGDRFSSVFRPSRPTNLLHILKIKDQFAPPENHNLEIDRADRLPWSGHRTLH